MNYVYEFEIFPVDGMYAVLPFDLEGATQGETFEDACRMAVDWLQIAVDNWQSDGTVPPKATFGNEPSHGGRTVIVAASTIDDRVAASA